MTPEETFFDAPSSDHPVRWSPSDGSGDKWLSLNDAVHRLHRVLGVQPFERQRYGLAKKLLEGRKIVTLWADYQIEKGATDA